MIQGSPEVDFENIESVEDCICIRYNLFFGKKPRSDFFKKPPAAFNTIVSLCDSTPWFLDEYIVPLEWHFESFIIENRRLEDDNTTEDGDSGLLDVAKKIVQLCSGDKKCVFVYGHEATRYACIVALLARYFLESDQKPLETLHRDVLRSQEHITCDFPASPEYTKQLTRIIEKDSRSIKQFFTKRHKKNK